MKKVLMIICAALLISGCGGKDINDMSYKKIYVIGLDAEFAPMGFRDEKGEIVGFDIYLAKEAAQRMGVEF